MNNRGSKVSVSVYMIKGLKVKKFDKVNIR